MNQIIRMKAHANENTASTVGGLSYAKKLASEGKNPGQISVMVWAAGYRIKNEDVAAVCQAYQDHLAALARALEAGK